MGVEVYVWTGEELRRVEVEFSGDSGIAISGVCGSRTRALRDRIYAMAQQEGFNLERMKIVVTPALAAGSTEGIEVAATIAARLRHEFGVKDDADKHGFESHDSR